MAAMRITAVHSMLAEFLGKPVVADRRLEKVRLFLALHIFLFFLTVQEPASDPARTCPLLPVRTNLLVAFGAFNYFKSLLYRS